MREDGGTAKKPFVCAGCAHIQREKEENLRQEHPTVDQNTEASCQVEMCEDSGTIKELSRVVSTSHELSQNNDEDPSPDCLTTLNENTGIRRVEGHEDSGAAAVWIAYGKPDLSRIKEDPLQRVCYWISSMDAEAFMVEVLEGSGEGAKRSRILYVDREVPQSNEEKNPILGSSTTLNENTKASQVEMVEDSGAAAEPNITYVNDCKLFLQRKEEENSTPGQPRKIFLTADQLPMVLRFHFATKGICKKCGESKIEGESHSHCGDCKALPPDFLKKFKPIDLKAQARKLQMMMDAPPDVQDDNLNPMDLKAQIRKLQTVDALCDFQDKNISSMDFEAQMRQYTIVDAPPDSQDENANPMDLEAQIREFQMEDAFRVEMMRQADYTIQDCGQAHLAGFVDLTAQMTQISILSDEENLAGIADLAAQMLSRDTTNTSNTSRKATPRFPPGLPIGPRAPLLRQPATSSYPYIFPVINRRDVFVCFPPTSSKQLLTPFNSPLKQGADMRFS